MGLTCALCLINILEADEAINLREDALTKSNEKTDKYSKMLGEAIRKLRLDQGQSQREFAAEHDISWGYVPKLESGSSIPNDPQLIGMLERELADFAVKDWIDAERERRKRVSPSKIVPNLIFLLKLLLQNMTDDELAITFLRVERRLGEFREDLPLLSENVKRFLLGNLSLEEHPDNGLRPLCHYLDSWNSSIEGWPTAKCGSSKCMGSNIEPTGLNTDS